MAGRKGLTSALEGSFFEIKASESVWELVASVFSPDISSKNESQNLSNQQNTTSELYIEPLTEE